MKTLLVKLAQWVITRYAKETGDGGPTWVVYHTGSVPITSLKAEAKRKVSAESTRRARAIAAFRQQSKAGTN